jgi:hypothetical protein
MDNPRYKIGKDGKNKQIRWSGYKPCPTLAEVLEAARCEFPGMRQGDLVIGADISDDGIILEKRLDTKPKN